jgi:hypothetical protein
MSEEKHTPGPWRIVIDDDGNSLSGRPMIAAAPELDCAIVHWDGFEQEFWESARGKKEMHANARLIAAAPDLLEALERCLNFIENTESEMGDTLECGDKARAAIAKAKGEA